MFLVAVITVLILILLLPTTQELVHWPIPVGIHISMSEFDIHDGVSLVFP